MATLEVPNGPKTAVGIPVRSTPSVDGMSSLPVPLPKPVSVSEDSLASLNTTTSILKPYASVPNVFSMLPGSGTSHSNALLPAPAAMLANAQEYDIAASMNSFFSQVRAKGDALVADIKSNINESPHSKVFIENAQKMQEDVASRFSTWWTNISDKVTPLSSEISTTLSTTSSTAVSAVTTASVNAFSDFKTSVASQSFVLPMLGLSVSSASDCFGFSWTQRLALFALMAGGGIFLLCTAGFLLPMAVLSPTKFVFAFTLGSILLFFSSSALRGWKTYSKSLLFSGKEKTALTLLYIASLLLTLISCIQHFFLLTLTGFILQVGCLAYMIITAIPGAKTVLGI